MTGVGSKGGRSAWREVDRARRVLLAMAVGGTCVAMSGCVKAKGGTDSATPGAATTAKAVVPAPLAPAPLPTPNFPTDWIGDWRGPAKVSRADGPAIEFTMGLTIMPTATPGTHTWTITYAGDAGTQVRPYTIAGVSGKPGAFVIDEKNSILIDATDLDGGLYSTFEIQGTTINVVYRLDRAGPDGDRIIVELASHDASSARDSGGKDGVPSVKSFSPTSLQRAVLKRVGATTPTGAPARSSRALSIPDPAIKTSHGAGRSLLLSDLHRR
jgi:hypothetical protein